MKKNKGRIVIALGGNALGNNAGEQQQKVEEAAPALVALMQEGYDVIISHGNGPQVGMINLAFAEAAEDNAAVPLMPLAECTAMSQGYIGYHLQKGLHSAMNKAGLSRPVAAMVTQMVVDEADPGFLKPTKPIGPYYTEEEAKSLMAQDARLYYAEDAGRGWRQMVASPRPRDIVEKDSILQLLDNNFVVIACGGGGIPVVQRRDGGYDGVAAVIDKDFASEKLAELVDADYLFILTAVDRVAIGFGTPAQKELPSMTVAEAEAHIQNGEFAPGSMLPKVEAAVAFAKSKPGRKAVIAALENAPLALKGLSGTEIYAEN